MGHHEKFKSQHIIVKILSAQNQESIWKAETEKYANHVKKKKKLFKIIANFLMKNLQARKAWRTIFQLQSNHGN